MARPTSCFALAAYRAPELTSEVIKVTQLSPGRWADILTRLRPLCSLLNGEPLDEVSLVRVGGRLIALAQPLTLVAPSWSLVDFRSERPPVPWMKDGRLLDSLQVAGLSGEERAILVRFLSTLCIDLERAQNGRDDVTALLGFARDFLDEALLGAAKHATMQFETEPARLALPGLQVFGAMRRRERAVSAGDPISDCLLQLRPSLPRALRGVILVDLAIHQQLGRPAGELRIWKHVSLRMLQERPERLLQIRAEAQAEGYLILKIERAFSAETLPRGWRGGRPGIRPTPARRAKSSPAIFAIHTRASRSLDARAGLSICGRRCWGHYGGPPACA